MSEANVALRPGRVPGARLRPAISRLSLRRRSFVIEDVGFDATGSIFPYSGRLDRPAWRAELSIKEGAGLMAISERESQQIEKANGSDRTPVIFIHGLWLLPSSWDNWVDFFEQNGYAGLTPDWPDDPETVEEARANPDVLAKKTLNQVADHTQEVIERLQRKPAVMGHSTGGLLAQLIADRGLSAATVAIDPGPFRGVLPLPISTLRVSAPILLNPLNRGKAITLTLDQFKYGWANALSDEETKQLYETYHVAAPGVALMQMAYANLNPWTEAKLDPKNPERGPLLILDGEKDHTVPWAIANASYKQQRKNEAVTKIEKIPNRGHSLTIDSGWREVAQKALDFIKRFT
jgi:pimeloyl-ACP methyl ester carboxylesterase